MNNKILSIKRNSAIFLATVLVLGTITLLSTPSFMKDVQAQQDYRTNSYDSEYGMDNDYKDRYGKDSYASQYSSYGKDNYKSKDNVIVKKINCNNINVNVNGLELNGLPPFLGNLLASDGQDGYGEGSSYGSGSYSDGVQSGYDKNNSFKFVCINNNNNTVVGVDEDGGGVTPPPEPTITCEECFTTNLNATQLSNITLILSNEDFTIERYCEEFLSNSTIPNDNRFGGLAFLLLFGQITDFEGFLRIAECLEELGIITIPPPPED